MVIPYKPNESVIFSESEKCALLLLYLGRDQRIRGISGFNLNYELQQNNLLITYMALRGEGLIEVLDSETVSDVDGTATFEKCRLTEKGISRYELLEDAIKRFTGSFRVEPYASII